MSETSNIYFNNSWIFFINGPFSWRCIKAHGLAWAWPSLGWVWVKAAWTGLLETPAAL